MEVTREEKHGTKCWKVAVRKPFKHKGQNIEFSHPLLIFSI